MPAQKKQDRTYWQVCPWWLAYTFDNPLRKFFHQPSKMLGAFVREGMTVMDVGCGMGFFSIAMARMVGDGGCVIAADLQPKMLDVMAKRAKRAGVAQRIVPHRCEPGAIGINTAVDFILTFWMVHEVGNQKAFFSQLRSILVPEGRILIAEPRMHVRPEHFQQTLQTARAAGLIVAAQPPIRLSLTALLQAC